MATKTQSKQAGVEDLNPFHIAQLQFDRAARYIPSLKAGLVDFLKAPNRMITVEFPIETAEGEVRNFVGYRCMHNRVRGPGNTKRSPTVQKISFWKYQLMGN